MHKGSASNVWRLTGVRQFNKTQFKIEFTFIREWPSSLFLSVDSNLILTWSVGAFESSNGMCIHALFYSSILDDKLAVIEFDVESTVTSSYVIFRETL